MSKIYVHIGLPKTATTTLQKDVFSKFKIKKVKYFGVYQPRKMQQSKVYQYFYEAVVLGENIDVVQSILEDELKKGADMLISDEMFVVSSENIDWRKKLENLSLVLKPFDYKIIVTVREPAEAMFSYYVELYKNFKNQNKNFIEIALNDPIMEIYHYKKFFSKLLKCFDKNKIFVKTFEDIIVNRNQDLLDFMEIGNGEFFLEKLILKNNNVKRKQGNALLTEHDTSLSDVLIKYLTKIGAINLIQAPCFMSTKKLVSNHLSKYRIRSRNRINMPSREELMSLRLRLKDETLFLNELFGINYILDIPK